MEGAEFFLVEHALAHSGQLVGVEEYDRAFYEDRAVRDLDETQLRMRPNGLNSIVWLLWHIARTEDAAANSVIAKRAQVLEEAGWAARLNVSRRDIGTGMTPAEVAALSDTIDIPSLRAYRLAVGRRTREVVQRLRPEDWQVIVDASAIRGAFAAGVFLPDHTWPYDFWGGKAVARLLAWPCLGHSLMHLGQAMWVRKLVLAQASPG
ncbi:MAG: DinB family protein [Armatimonadetes bacterium]|nr:DinB family protein [Armatimonadota bacterium]